MARKKLYPGGFRLTLATARRLAVQEFGTAKGLKQADWCNSEGFYEMTLGNLEIEIHPDMSGSGCIQIAVSMNGTPGHIYQFHDRDTLHQNYEREDVQRRKDRRDAFEEWVSADGPEPCHKAIDDFWNERR